MAIAKHFILNNQETDRSGVNEIVDEKTIMELYAPPFAAAAAANVAGYSEPRGAKTPPLATSDACPGGRAAGVRVTRRSVRLQPHQWKVGV